MRRIGILAAVVSTVLMAGPIGCGSKSPTSQTASTSGSKVMVFAAASLKPSFTQIGQQFTNQNPGVGVDFEFAGSSVSKAGLLSGNPTNFASNTLVIVTAPGNPKKIGSFADLAKPGLNVVTCQQPVPCGAATHRVEDSTGVRLNPVSEELSVTDALNKVTSGQADAALVYVTDANSAGSKVATVNFPEAAGAVNVYPIGVLKKAPLAAQAQKFVDLVTSPAGQQILAQAGFAKP
jgi:molybdate transport system substrate-binding protein